MGAHISALRLGNPFGCIPRPFLPGWPRGQAQRLRLVPPPGRQAAWLPEASRVKASPGDPHPLPALRFGLRLPVPPLTPLPAKRR